MLWVMQSQQQADLSLEIALQASYKAHAVLTNGLAPSQITLYAHGTWSGKLEMGYDLNKQRLSAFVG
jgi:hypothetical protein